MCVPGMHKNYRALPEVERALPPGTPLTYFNGRGGAQVIFLDLKFWPKVIFFRSMKDAGIFFWVAEKKTRDFWGLRKKD